MLRSSPFESFLRTPRSPTMGGPVAGGQLPAATHATPPGVSEAVSASETRSAPLPLLLQSQMLMCPAPLCSLVMERSPCLSAVALFAVTRRGQVGTFHITPSDRLEARPSPHRPWVHFVVRTALNMSVRPCRPWLPPPSHGPGTH